MRIAGATISFDIPLFKLLRRVRYIGCFGWTKSQYMQSCFPREGFDFNRLNWVNVVSVLVF